MAVSFWPIIYVRGFARTQGDIDDTTADPFCGFNIGSTTYRAALEKAKPPRKFVFESPLVRLTSDFGYQHVFDQGMDITDAGWMEVTQREGIPTKSVIIHRYYEQASSLLGTGETPPIQEFAKGLSDLILAVRKLVCGLPENKLLAKDFRCFLVAHSMGGLVVRAFLQNPECGDDSARKCVDKVFTYATPHNGIDVAGMNVPNWFSLGDTNNFNREKMADYLNLKALYKATQRVDWLPESAFPSERFFCMIGTNRADYEAAMSLSRTFVGHGSDGLVRIENASVWGTANMQGKVSAPCATAYAFRSHSGFFGIVNSEESYQNLIRFLFGDVRVDLWVDIESVSLPTAVNTAAGGDKSKVSAQYQFETLVSPRGARWFLTRRVAEEDSVAVRTYEQLRDAAPALKTDRSDNTSVYLSTVFLGKQWKVKPGRRSLAYALTLGIRVGEYQIEKKFWFDSHFEGGYAFRDTVVIELSPPENIDGDWKVSYSWQDNTVAPKVEKINVDSVKDGGFEILVPFGDDEKTLVTGKLRFFVTPWNI